MPNFAENAPVILEEILKLLNIIIIYSRSKKYNEIYQICFSSKHKISTNIVYRYDVCVIIHQCAYTKKRYIMSTWSILFSIHNRRLHTTLSQQNFIQQAYSNRKSIVLYKFIQWEKALLNLSLCGLVHPVDISVDDYCTNSSLKARHTTAFWWPLYSFFTSPVSTDHSRAILSEDA